MIKLCTQAIVGQTHEAVEELDVLPGPDIGAFDGEQDIPLVCHDAVHHDVIEDRPNEGTEHLHHEGDAWRQMAVLRELQVTAEVRSLCKAIVSL